MNGASTEGNETLRVRSLIALRWIVAVVVALGATGCASFTPVVREPMRIGTTDDLSATALGLRAGVTTLEEARATMVQRGMTGIAEDAYVPSSGPVVAALGADYQSRVHVFRDGRYHQSVELGSYGKIPYGMVLRLGADETSTMLLVLYRDPLGRRSEPPELVSYRWTSKIEDRDGIYEDSGANAGDPYEAEATADGFSPAGRTSLANLVGRHGGMTSPILVGADLSEGALLIARDERGRVWDKGYLVRTKSGAVALDAMPWSKAMRCSCVQKYSFALKKL